MQLSLLFIVDALSGLYISMFVLRFILQWIRASYQSPLAQFVLQITAPIVVPAGASYRACAAPISRRSW